MTFNVYYYTFANGKQMTMETGAKKQEAKRIANKTAKEAGTTLVDFKFIRSYKI